GRQREGRHHRSRRAARRGRRQPSQSLEPDRRDQPQMALPARLRNSLALTLLLASCGGTLPPQWQSDAVQAMAAFQRACLTGDSERAEVEFKELRKQLSSTGRAELVARAELVRCAARSASLEFDDCPGFLALKDEAGAENRRYADYLLG